MTELTKWGATPEDWDLFDLTLGLGKDMLPVVCNPGAPISPNSRMQKVGKTPSIYNREGYVAGMTKWTDRQTSLGELSRWRAQPDYGFCLQTRHVRALDIDVPDRDKAMEILTYIACFFEGMAVPVRSRKNSGKCLAAFYVPGDFGKRAVKVDGGIVEFLATGQQFVAAGMHESGVPYQWNWHNLEDFPTLTKEQADTLWAAVVDKFGIAEPSEGGLRKERTDGEVVTDRVAQHLESRGLVLSFGQEGQAFIECPFKADHTSESVESATAYFPAGSRGYAQGHFHCLHAHCAHRTDADFMAAFGLTVGEVDDFDEVAPEEAEKPKKEPSARALAKQRDAELDYPYFDRNKEGKIKPIVNNIAAALERPDICGYTIGYDDFRGEHMLTPYGQDMGWVALEEYHYSEIQHTLELGLCGFAPITFETLKREIKYAGYKNRFDSAVLWLKSLPDWDGTPRVESFISAYMKGEDNAYTRAIGRYMWSAMAGRVLQPGIKADMTPIFFGAQGVRKSTAIELIAPAKDFFTKMSFAEKDDDLTRKLRGKLVIEIDELRGLNTREADFIKSFIAKTDEHWVKKYEERTSSYARRCLFMGSTNVQSILADDTGERRWLPTEVGIGGEIIDTDRIKADRDQLWAEGVALFMADGVDWSAEKLAHDAHEEFAVVSLWTEPVVRWLHEVDEIDGKAPADKPHLTTLEVLSGALNIDPRHAKKADEWEVGRVLKKAGWVNVRLRTGDGKRGRVWVKKV